MKCLPLPRYHGHVELRLAKRSHPVSWIPGKRVYGRVWKSNVDFHPCGRRDAHHQRRWASASPRSPHFLSPGANDLSRSALLSAVGAEAVVSLRDPPGRGSHEPAPSLGRPQNAVNTASPGCAPVPPLRMAARLPGPHFTRTHLPPSPPPCRLPPDPLGPARGRQTLPLHDGPSGR